MNGTFNGFSVNGAARSSWVVRAAVFATAVAVAAISPTRIVHATAHDTFHLPLENSAMMGMVVTLAIRLAAIRWHLKLPTFALDEHSR